MAISNPDTKPTYAPLPARVIGDKTLTGEELRVLAALAVHDRLGANGMGCYASHSRLAALVGCHEKSLSRSLSTLATRGYISASRHPLNARLRVYKVLYSDEDATSLKSIGNRPATYDEPTGNKPATENPQIGNKPNPETQQKQQDESANILGEAIRYPAEAVNRSRESAPRAEKRENVGGKLAMLERGFKAGKFSKREIAEEVLPWLQGLIEGELDYSSPEFGRAFRLFEDLGGMVS
jgi:hypothetical protein